MNYDWDLSVFYNGFDDPALRRDIDAVKPLVEEGQALLKADLPAQEKLEGALTVSEKLNDLLSRAMMFTQLTLSVKSDNAEAFRVAEELSALLIEVNLLESATTRFIGEIDDLEALIAKSEKLAENAFVLREGKQQASHLLPPDMEKWMLRMSLSGADSFSKLRDQLMGSLTVDMDGKQLPLPAVRGLASDPDADVRKRAYEAELASYSKVALPMAFCLGGIKGEALTMCDARGYSDILSEQLEESRMDHETLDAMWTAVREYLPHFRRYLRAKAKLLGHKDGLPFYDICAPVGSSAKKYTVEEAKELLKDTFGKAHPAMADFMMHAFDNRWIDFFPKEGKEGGAFCAENHELKLCRVLTNFIGSFSDVSTLAHELGHGWHAHCMEHTPVLMAQPPMPLAETASTFNETLLAQTVLATATPDEAFTLLEGNLMESTQCVVDIYSRFLFESAVFEARKTHTPSVEELRALMLDAQEQAYGDGLAKDSRHPDMWINKVHYYNVGLHFYNFPYAFGLLFGLGVFQKYRAEGAAFLPKYDQMLAYCGSDTVANVAKTVGIDVHSVDYWRSALDVLKSEIDEFEQLVNAKC